MELIYHRRNTIADLVALDPKYGVEVDIRSNGSDLIIHHDALCDGISFKEWIKYYKHGTLILNVKEEGLEQHLIGLMAKEQIENFFFLDQSFPFLIKTANLGETRCAVRVSEFESVETALSLGARIDWVWLDCFTKFPIEPSEYRALKQVGLKLCLVSPELQGRIAETEIIEMFRFMQLNEIHMDAICTKFPKVWEKLLT